MQKLTTSGSINALLMTFIGVCVVLIVSLVFGFSYYSKANKYKNDADTLIAQAVAAAEAKQATQLENQFKVESENPFTSYTGPSQYGSVYVPYPKNWSGYINTSGSNPLDAYFNPGVVPSVGGSGSVYALRVQINANPYSQQLQQYTSQQQSSKLSITPFQLKKVPQVTGVLIQGQIEPNKTGDMVMLPDRTNTLELWTESTSYNSIFLNQILPSVTFSP